jgi:hypothetical protein
VGQIVFQNTSGVFQIAVDLPEQFIMRIDDPPGICLVGHDTILTGARGYVKGIEYQILCLILCQWVVAAPWISHGAICSNLSIGSTLIPCLICETKTKVTQKPRGGV